MLKGVITGDLVNSTNISPVWRQLVIDALSASVSDCNTLTPVRMEIYRGDSFQVLVEDPEYSLAVAIALRAKLRAATPENQEIWDARLSVGVGNVSFETGSILTSDGEAFRLSGRAFDSIGKKRLTLATPWEEFDYALDLLTRFADEIISSWTVRQATIVSHSLIVQKKQKDMAKELNMTRQNFNYLWNSAKAQLIFDYIKYFKALVIKRTTCLSV